MKYHRTPYLIAVTALCALFVMPAMADNTVSSTLTVKNETDQDLRFEVTHINSGKIAKREKVGPGKGHKFTFNFKDCHKPRDKKRRINVIHVDSDTQVAKIDLLVKVAVAHESKHGCDRDYIFSARKNFDSNYKLNTQIGTSKKNGTLTVR